MITDPLLRTQAAALYHEGWTVEEIAEELNIPVADVIEWCNKLI